jgi:hypothetical protein
LTPDIIRSIWNETCRASHVVVDITELDNVNVALELGMAHVLGRNVLIISQIDKDREPFFRTIAKVRIHWYSSNGNSGLRWDPHDQGILDQFLALS